MKIGIEVHIQLPTQTKMFCRCKNPSTTTETEPNTFTCENCLGLPGSKPVLNKEAVFQAIKLALALKCNINKESFFSRKTYFYPDLPKNFQITQYEIPIAENGFLKNIRIRRLHLEEDPGRLIHEGSSTLIDYNRSGIPLVELVTEPDFKSPAEVREFLKELLSLLAYLQIYTRTSEASLRTDANISTTGERVEVKNITGLRDVEKALNYEAKRQQQEVTDIQQTRSWIPDKQITILTRTKETEEDYGYIFEPDLTKIEITQKQISNIKKSLPELATEKTKRFTKEYKIELEDAKTLTSELLLAELFEKTAQKISPKLAAKWLRREIPRVLNYNKKSIHDLEIDETHLIELLNLLETKQITENTAKKILEKLIEKPFRPSEYIKKQNLTVISKSSEIEKYCKESIKKNPQAVEDYKKGNENALNFLIGYVMKKTRGQASHEELIKIFKKLING
tara:strand:- start:3781 stop:5139 length:1359 start_codon:yes stop_codon:yes gene_type:complete